MPLKVSTGFSSAISAQEADSVCSDNPKGVIPPIPLSDKEKKNRCTIDLTTKEREFLRDVWRHKTSPVTERYVRLGLSRRVGNETQSSLVRRSFLRPVFVSIGSGRIKTFSLTEKGKKALGIEDQRSKRHGGVEHQYWQERLAERLKQMGWQVEAEYPIGGGKTIDLVAAKDGRRIAFEVETGNSDIAANVRKIPPGKFDKLVVVLTSAPARAQAKGLRRPGLKVVRAADLDASLAKTGGFEELNDSSPRFRLCPS